MCVRRGVLVRGMCVWMDDGFWHLQAMGHGDGGDGGDGGDASGNGTVMLWGSFYEYHGRFEGILPHGGGRNPGAGLVTGGLVGGFWQARKARWGSALCSILRTGSRHNST